MSRQMKDSGVEWIGEVPEGWEIRPIKYQYKIVSGATPKSENPNFWDGDIQWVTPSDFKTEDKFVSHGAKSITIDGYHSCSTTLVPEGSLVFSKRAPVGTVAIAINELCTNQGCLSCIPKAGTNPTFGYYEMYIAKQAFEQAAQGTTFMEISADKFANFKLPYCSPSEQSQIVHFLDRKCSAIDAAIEKTKESIEKLEKYKKAVITKAVTKGLDPDAKMKDSGMEWIGEVPEGWEIRPLKFTSDSISKGNGITKDDVVEDGDMQCVRYGEIYFQYDLSFSQCKSKTRLNKVSSPQFFSYGDILCAGTGELIDEIGKPIVYLGDQNCLAGGDIVIVKHKQNPRFLEYALSSSYAQAQRSLGKYKLKVVHISAGEIGSIKIALPNITEQNRIADYLDNKIADITKVIDNKLAVISKWEEYKKSLIYYAVTGKIDCRNEVL